MDRIDAAIIFAVAMVIFGSGAVWFWWLDEGSRRWKQWKRKRKQEDE